MLMKKRLLVMFMALMSAITLWAGQLIIDDNHIIASPSSPNPGETVTLTVDFSNEMLVMRLSDLLVYEEVGGNLIEPPLTVTLLPGTPDPLAFPYIGYYTFTMPTSGNDVHVFSVFAHSPVHCMQSNNGSCQVSLVEGQPLPPGSDPQNPQVGDNFEVTLTATPNPGFELASYYVIAESGQAMIVDANGVFYKPDGPVQVYANFKTPGTHFVNIDPNYILNPNSDLDVFANPEYASDGTLVRLDVNPRPSDVWVRNIYYKSYPDGNNIWQDVFVEDGQLWFKMPDPDDDVLVNVITDYSPTASDPHQISIASGITGGSVAVSQPQAARGEIIRLDLYPDPGYMLDQVFVDDLFPDKGDRVEVRPNGIQEYLFTMPGGHDVTVSATFVPNSTYMVNVDMGTVDGTIYAKAGSEGGPNVPSFTTEMGHVVRLFNTPNPGFELDQYFVTDLSTNSDVPLQGGGNNPRFIMPASDVFVTAAFKPKSYNILINFTPNNGGNVTVANPIDPNDYIIGNLIKLDILPNPGFTIGTITVIRDDDMTSLAVSPDYEFTMPPCNVTVTVTFTAIPHTLYVETAANNPLGTITNVTISSNPATPTPYNQYYNKYYPVDVTDVIQATCVVNNLGDVLKEYVLDYHDENIGGDNLQTITIPNPPGPYSMTATLTIPTFPGDMWLRAVYGPYDFNVVVRSPVYGGSADAWLNNTTLILPQPSTTPPPHYNDLIVLKDYPDPGFELDRYDIYNANSGTLVTGLLLNTPDLGYHFYMPLYDVIVVPVFRLKTFYVRYDDRPINGGDLYVWNDSANPVVGGPGQSTVIPATMGQTIRMIAQPGQRGMYFNYFYLTKVSDGSYMGDMQYSGNYPNAWYTPNPLNMVSNNHTENWYEQRISMPPLNVDLWVRFADGIYDIQNPTPFPILTYSDVNIRRGVIILHQHQWKKSSVRSDTGWDEPENYGWASAVPGQPVYFTVAPAPGYQMKKSDITLRLLDMSQGGDGQLFRVLSGSNGEIDGPDEEITGPTDFSFIFDVPDGVDPNFVKLAIDADFGNVEYTITVADGIEHGTVEVVATAKMDETVTINVTPEPGYRLASLTVTPETPGFFTIEPENGQFVMPSSNVIVTATFEEADYVVGDVNGDSVINISDVTMLINLVLNGTPLAADHPAADYNCDGEVNITDVTALINYVLNN